jgi:hypothetical protein
MSNPILNLKDKIIPIATLLMALFFLPEAGACDINKAKYFI